MQFIISISLCLIMEIIYHISYILYKYIYNYVHNICILYIYTYHHGHDKGSWELRFEPPISVKHISSAEKMVGDAWSLVASSPP